MLKLGFKKKCKDRGPPFIEYSCHKLQVMGLAKGSNAPSVVGASMAELLNQGSARYAS